MTMIEKVARAMCVAEGIDPDAKAYRGELLNYFGIKIIPPAELIFPAWTFNVPAAKAAIEALKEPTEELKKFEAPDYNIFDWGCACHYCGGHKFAVQSYIDKALKE